MKSYRVTVDGQTFEVTVEECQEGSPPPVAARPAPAAAAAPSPAPQPPATSPGAGLLTAVQPGEKPIHAPMPGKILEVKVVSGDTVARGAVVAVLEAMKMENDILAPVDGTVRAVRAQAGDTVNTGDVLLVLE